MKQFEDIPDTSHTGTHNPRLPAAVRLFEQATRVSSDKLSNMTDGYILCVLLAVQVLNGHVNTTAPYIYFCHWSI